MRNFWVRVGWALGAGLGAFLVLVLAIVVFANTNPGRNAVAALLNPLLGGKVAVAGLSGRFPDAPTAEHVEISDARGVWLKLDRVSAKWSPLQLLRNRIVAHTVSAERAFVMRIPVQSKSEGTTPPIDVKELEVGRLTIGQGIASHSAVISVFGAVHYVTSNEFSGTLHARRLDAAGNYDVRVGLKNHDLVGVADVREPSGGLIQDVLHIPGLGALLLTATARSQADGDSIQALLAAGALRANAQGMIDLAHRSAVVSFAAQSPVMKLRPDLSWRSLTLNGRLGGAFDAPDVAAHLAMETLKADGGSAARLKGDLSGRRGDMRFMGAVSALRLPGSHPDLLAAAPVRIEAHGSFAARSIDVSLAHPLLSATAHIASGTEATQGVIGLQLPALAPLADAAGVDAKGSADFNALVTIRPEVTSAALNGAVRFDNGSSALARLLGRDARITGFTTVREGAVSIDQARIESSGASVSASGTWRGGVWNYSWAIALKDLSRLAGTLVGRVALQGTLLGRDGNLAATATGSGVMATKGYGSSPLRITVRAQGLPQSPAGTVDISGSLDKSPFALAAKMSRGAKGEWRLALDKADWRSIRARGDLVAKGSLSAPAGKIELHAGSLADLEPVIGQPVKGTLDSVVVFAPTGSHAHAQMTVTGEKLSYQGTAIAVLKIAGAVADPLTKPVAALSYTANGVVENGVSGNVSGAINGPQSALAVTLASDLHPATGPAATIATAATVDVPGKRLTLTRYDVHAGGDFAHLAQSAHFNLANGIAVDSLRIVAGQSELDAAGRFSPRLEATLNLRRATGDLLRPFLSGSSAQGTLSGTAKLSGTLSEPTGTVVLNGKGLKVGVDGGGAMPPADLTVNAKLHGTGVALNASMRSGTQIQFSLAGEAPLSAKGTFNLHAQGTENLAVLDPILNAVGRSLHGNLTVDTQITGTFAQPRVSGSGRLEKGEFQDFVRGIRISGIATTFNAHGDAIAISNFSAHAGEGTITGQGNIDLSAPGEPVSLILTARNARPVSNDVLNATLDANLKLAGKLAQQFTLSGNVTVHRGEIDIPENLPPSVEVLDVRGKGRAPPPKPIAMTLDLDVVSPGQLFVRGHGLDAEMSGNLHIGGTTFTPDVDGGFELRRGNLSIAGQTLDFSRGRVSFDGSSLKERIDPALDFTAQTTSGGITATLNVGGHASRPKITLTSSPPLPQDEILSRLLFQQNMTQLSPWQIAQLGQALASLSGSGSSLGDPLMRVRRSLGLDRLAVTTAGATGSQTAVEAGRYVARNVYVGAKQGVSGTGTQAVVQVDLTKHLKLQTQISSNNTPTPVTPGTVPVDSGSNLGLSYQFEY